MRHLVVSCDGTWSTPEQSHAGVPTPTNVVRLHHALTDSEVQLRYYHPGVGTGPGLVDRLRGGGMGAGLSANIKSAYAWLAGTHRPGDAICLFGFSRGAYTVRSLAGMLAACGLVRFAEGTGPAQRWAEIDRLYDEVYRPARRRARAVPHPPVTVDFLGVWDTVGALGIPDSFGVLNLVDDDERHRFHDTRLGAHVTHARHALALDETRGPFTPTAWTGPVPDGERTVRQVWFPGGHGDVGGGHPQPGLSDGALQWMIDEASVCTGLRFRKEVLEQIRPDPSDVLHDECTGFFRHLSPAPRAIPMIDESSAEVVHSSAFARRARPPITVGSYRPTRVLAVGEQARCPVYAGDPWNGTGLYLTPGRYRFRAEGEWLDRGLAVGPGGPRRPVPPVGGVPARRGHRGLLAGAVPRAQRQR